MIICNILLKVSLSVFINYYASQTTFENEIACIDVNAIDVGGRHTSQVCAVGLWTDIKVLLVRLPTMEILASHDLPGDILPRSLLLSRFEGVPYLLVGLGRYLDVFDLRHQINYFRIC